MDGQTTNRASASNDPGQHQSPIDVPPARRRTVVWLTNIPAPYRVPVWRHLAERMDLALWFAAASEPNRQWRVDVAATGATEARQLRTLAAPFLGSRIYLPCERSRLPRHIDAVVVGGWESPLYWMVARECRARGIPVVAFYESTARTHAFARGPVARLRRDFFQRADAMVTPGTAATQALLAMDIDPDRIYQGFNAVDNDWFADRARRHQPQGRRAGHGFLYVGQLINRKNVGALLSAFGRVRGPQDTLTIAGDGPGRPLLEQQARDSGLQGVVSFVGHRDQEEVADLYAASDTLVLPSTKEVWGLVANEALVSGCSVVISDRCGAAADLVTREGVFGCNPTAQSISEGMSEARRWGRVAPDAARIPGPKEYADVFARAVEDVVVARNVPDATGVR